MKMSSCTSRNRPRSEANHKVEQTLDEATGVSDVLVATQQRGVRGQKAIQFRFQRQQFQFGHGSARSQGNFLIPCILLNLSVVWQDPLRCSISVYPGSLDCFLNLFRVLER